jgi:diguanylate cyclase (GGDEF)-like protein
LANAVKEGEGALLIIDLDSFKLVNDLYGHDIGDKILIRFSELIRSVTRDSDVTGRIGGDEFAVYCDGMTSEKAIQEKCIYLNREILKTAREYMGNDMDIPLGCSVGAVFVPQGGREYGTLFSKADMALHRAKKDGKHDCSIFRDEAEMTQEERSDDIFSLKMIFGERNRNRSAIIADKDMFRDIYRFLVRFSVRSAWNPRLVVFTLQGSESAAISACTDQFMEISAKHLRSCDVLLKYNASQVIILLTGAREEDFDIPIDRLMKAWEKEGVDQIQVTYQLESKIG